MLLAGLFLLFGPAHAQSLVDQAFGWANGVSGGGSARPLNVSTGAEFRTAVSGDLPKVIYVSGTIDLGIANPARVGSNTSILGVGSKAKLLHGGLIISGESNIIIRNISFEDARDPNWQCEKPVEGGQPSNCVSSNANYDNLGIQNGSSRIWIDHCTFSNNQTTKLAYDGQLDIKNGSDYITISYCVFKNGQKALLVGAGDSDAGNYRITYAYNWFQGVESRAPRVRFGRVHLLNNYYSGIGSYAVGVGHNARIYAEKNYFYSSSRPSDQISSTGQIRNVGNKFNNCSPNGFEAQLSSVGWVPYNSYQYTALNVDEVPAHVQANAGTGKITVETLCSGCASIPQGRYVIRARHSGGVLDVEGYSRHSGANVQQWGYNYQANQQWDISSVGGGYYKVISVNSGLGLDVEGNSTTKGANIQQWGYSAGYKNKEFSFEYLGNGYYRIKARHSGQCIDVSGASVANGANVIQWPCSSGYNQQWQLETVGSTSSAARSQLTGAETDGTLAEENVLSRIYPNPSSAGFTVSLAGFSQQAVTIEVVNATGSILYATQTTTSTLEIKERFSPGVYVIKLRSASKQQTLKLLIR